MGYFTRDATRCQSKVFRDAIRPQLADRMPHRYARNVDRTWSCPPGEAYTQPFGLFYRIQSSAQIDWVYQRNLRFLEDYLRFSRPPIEPEVTTAIRARVMSKPALTLLELLARIASRHLR